MSQEKVNKYKEEKKNRKKNLEKQKRMKRIYSIVGILVAICLVAGIGVAIYYSKNPKPSTSSVSENDVTSKEDAINIIQDLINNPPADSDTDATRDASTDDATTEDVSVEDTAVDGATE